MQITHLAHLENVIAHRYVHQLYIKTELEAVTVFLSGPLKG